MYRTVVTICTASLTINNSTFCPHNAFVLISEQTAIISLYNIDWLVCITETECLLRGTDWSFDLCPLKCQFKTLRVTCALLLARPCCAAAVPRVPHWLWCKYRRSQSCGRNDSWLVNDKPERIWERGGRLIIEGSVQPCADSEWRKPRQIISQGIRFASGVSSNTSTERGHCTVT